MAGTDVGQSPIIQPIDGEKLRPMSNRGEVYAFLHSEDCSHPIWFAPFRSEKHPFRVATVDMVRLSLKFQHHSADHDKDFTEWCDFFRKYARADFADRFVSTAPAKYREVFTLVFDAHHTEVGSDGVPRTVYSRKERSAVSISAGVGFNKPDSAVSKTAGFIEFNPNKTAIHAYLLLQALQAAYKVTFEVSRWDFATDVPIPRKTALVGKDSRSYECHISRSVTTYLGQRNTPGRVKVYDKTAESNLSEDWTRIEVTYARPKSAEDGISVPKPTFWPLVGQVRAVTVSGAPDTTAAAEMPCSPETMALVQSLSLLHQVGQDVVPLLQMLEVRMRRRVSSLLVPASLAFDVEAWRACASLALAWETPLALVPALRSAGYDFG